MCSGPSSGSFVKLERRGDSTTSLLTRKKKVIWVESYKMNLVHLPSIPKCLLEIDEALRGKVYVTLIIMNHNSTSMEVFLTWIMHQVRFLFSISVCWVYVFHVASWGSCWFWPDSCSLNYTWLTIHFFIHTSISPSLISCLSLGLRLPSLLSPLLPSPIAIYTIITIRLSSSSLESIYHRFHCLSLLNLK